MLYDMASEYMQNMNSKEAKLEVMAIVYDIDVEELTKAKIKRFEEIRQEIVENFESKLKQGGYYRKPEKIIKKKDGILSAVVPEFGDHRYLDG